MTAPASASAPTLDAPTDLLVENRGGIRILCLARGKANALSTEFAHALHTAAVAAQEDPSVKGVVLTSTNPKIFSAGFDLRKLAHATDEDFARFVRVFDTLFFDLFLLGKPLVAALPGHAIAGGALVASTADFRFAAEGPGRIGLPEVTLGIHVPRHYLEAMRTTVGEQALTRWALLGETMPFEEAMGLGAIDRIVPADRLVEEAVAFAERLGGASSEVYAAIKRDLRGSAYERALDIQPDARKAFVESWFSETGQRGLSRALQH